MPEKFQIQNCIAWNKEQLQRAERYQFSEDDKTAQRDIDRYNKNILELKKQL